MLSLEEYNRASKILTIDLMGKVLAVDDRIRKLDAFKLCAENVMFRMCAD